jgi:hypothetical protein
LLNWFFPMVFQRNGSQAGTARRIAGCVLAALVWVAAAGTAWAQGKTGDVTQARELFVQASELRDEGDLRGALEKFKAAHALAVNPITSFELARTYAALGMLVEARDTYASIAGLPVQADETERAALARRDGAQAVEDLKSRVPTLKVKVAAPPDAVSITLDGEPVPAAELVAPRAVDPGTHHIVATGASGGRAEQTIAVKEGESREVDLELVPPSGAHEPRVGAAPQGVATSAADASRQAPDGSGNHFGPFAYAGFGVGAAGFLVGTILAAATLSTASSIDCSTTSCAQSSVDSAHSARDLGIAAVVSYTIGGLGVAVGVTDLLIYKRGPTPPAQGISVHPWIGAGAAGLHGSF